MEQPGRAKGAGGQARARGVSVRATTRRRDRRLERELEAIERGGGDGEARIAADLSLHVSNLDKVYFPDVGKTKGDVMRYYVRAAPLLLPLIEGRPLILKRYPDGVAGESFYQHAAPGDPPPGVQVGIVPDADGTPTRRFIGGNVATLLHLTQLGSIAVNPWHSRVGALESADYAILDLDPGPRAPFARIVEVALRLREACDTLGLSVGVKTSGASGLHLYIPLREGTPSESALALAQELATQVSEEVPRDATIARRLQDRPARAVYVDFLQNVTGKSVASAFSVRARPGATISMPLAWNELEGTVDPAAFTIDVTDAELDARGRIWRATMRRRNRLDQLGLDVEGTT